MSAADPIADYYNQVIYIESMRYRAFWLQSHKHHEAHLTETPRANVINDVGLKWIVRKGPGSTILLESVRFRNNYLAAHHAKKHHNAQVKYSAFPYDDDWALWYPEDIGSGNVSFRSKLHPDSRLSAHHSKKAHVSVGSGDWSVFKIYQPTVYDRKELLFSYDNTEGTTPVMTQYTDENGISKTHTTTESSTITTEMGVEIESIFSAKTSLSSTWSESNSATWSSEVTKTVAVEVSPGTKKEIYQLTGYYGEDTNKYRVCSDHLFFEG